MELIKELSTKELTTLLIREFGVSEGHYCLKVEFGLAAMNVKAKDGDHENLNPATMTILKSFSIQKAKENEDLALYVDASDINKPVKNDLRRKSKK